MIYLDNDILRKFAKPDPDPKVVDYLDRHRSEPWGVSTVVLYRRNRPSASGLDPEGEGRTLSWRSTFTMDG